MRITIIEDEKAHAELMERSIRKEFPDAQIDCFEGIEGCLKSLDRIDTDVIISDYSLSGGNGLDLLREIQKRGGDIPVIVVTGHGDERVAVQAMKLGAYDYLAKGGDFFSLVPGIIRKVVSDKQLKKALHESQALYRIEKSRFCSVLVSMVTPLAGVNSDMTIAFANPVFAQVFGKKLIGKPCRSIFQKSDDAGTRCLKAIEDRRTESLEFEDANGRIWQVMVSPATESEGDGLTGVLIFQDITGLKRAEKELQKAYNEMERRVEKRTAELAQANQELGQEVEDRKQAENALRESEQRFKAIADYSYDAEIWHGPDGRLLWINPAVERLSGYSVEECMRNPSDPLFSMIHEEDREMIERGLRQAIGEKTIGNNIPFRIRHKDGSTLWMAVSWQPIYGTDGTYLGIRSSIRDITKQKQAEEEKKKLQFRLQRAQRLESIGTLADGVAHNFNNLLMVILTKAGLSLSRMNPSHPAYKMLKDIEIQVERGAKLTGQLLGYARKGRYEVKPTNLNELVQETSDGFGEMRKDITIHRQFSEDLLAIEAEQEQVAQVLLNLYLNAADAMPGGGELILKTRNIAHDAIKSRLFDPRPGSYVHLEVADRGIGLDEETMGRIFDPFFTTKEVGKGTGLGLSSALGIIKSHGGYIDVESKKGQGTTFNLYFPAAGKKTIPEKVTAASGEITKGTGTILLVDDEAAVLDVTRDFLELMGYRVFTAGDGQEAVQVYKQNQDEIDMVLLDIVMPHMSGVETYDCLREINPDVKVLLLSGYNVHGEATELLEGGCKGFIQKPFGMSELSRKIWEILEKK